MFFKGHQLIYFLLPKHGEKDFFSGKIFKIDFSSDITRPNQWPSGSALKLVDRRC